MRLVYSSEVVVIFIYKLSIFVVHVAMVIYTLAYRNKEIKSRFLVMINCVFCRPKSSGSAGLMRRSISQPGVGTAPGGEFKLQEGMSVFCNNELGKATSENNIFFLLFNMIPFTISNTNK